MNHSANHPLAQRRRRAEAALRCAPLPRCGCRRDTETDRHRCSGQMTQKEAEAVVEAAEHLRALGLQPLFPAGVLRDAWRLCPEHRGTIETLIGATK